MIWIAVEDSDTHEVSEFERVTEEELRYLMDGYKVNRLDITRFRMRDIEQGNHVVYKGGIYKGGYGYNLWVASKYIEV